MGFGIFRNPPSKTLFRIISCALLLNQSFAGIIHKSSKGKILWFLDVVTQLGRMASEVGVLMVKFNSELTGTFCEEYANFSQH